MKPKSVFRLGCSCAAGSHLPAFLYLAFISRLAPHHPHPESPRDPQNSQNRKMLNQWTHLQEPLLLNPDSPATLHSSQYPEIGIA